MRLSYDVDGIQKVEHDLLGIGARALEPKPVLLLLARALRGIEQKLFASEGRGTWPPLAASTAAQKGSSRILVESKALVDSLTTEGASGSLAEIVGNELRFGTQVEGEDGSYYPGLLRSGTSRMPARDPLQVETSDLREFSRAIQTYLIGAERAQFGAGDFGIGQLSLGV